MKTPEPASTRYSRLMAAANIMIGRAQMSRHYGHFARANIQLKACGRLFILATKCPLT